MKIRRSEAISARSGRRPGRAGPLRLPAPDLRSDRRNRRWDDPKILLLPPDRDGEALRVCGAEIVGRRVRLRRQILDPDDPLDVGVGQGRRCGPPARIARTPPDVAWLALHGANDTGGPGGWQASRSSARGSRSYPRKLLPKTVLIFTDTCPSGRRRPSGWIGHATIGRKTKRPPTPMVSDLRLYRPGARASWW